MQGFFYILNTTENNLKTGGLEVVMSDWAEAVGVDNTDTGLALQQGCNRPLSCRDLLLRNLPSCVNPREANV